MRLRKKSSLRVVEHAELSDVGRLREGNEDSMLVDPPLFVVADGMGGAQAGEVASGLAVETLGEMPPDDGNVEVELTEAIGEANRRIHDKAQEDRELSGMGTTLTAAFVHDGKVTLGHVGDSRAYRFRDGALEQLTTDHSLVGELVRTGRLTEAEAAVHPHRSVITRALGTEADVEVDTLTIDLRAGDLVLICSDGLSAMVRDEEIVLLLEQAGADPHAAAEALVAAANRAGGEDNVTVVLFELVDGEPVVRIAPPESDGRETTAESVTPAAPANDDVSRHGPGKGSRWPALVLLVALIAIAAFLVWWSFVR
jgi:PPM family protein phosphatase